MRKFALILIMMGIPLFLFAGTAEAVTSMSVKQIIAWGVVIVIALLILVVAISRFLNERTVQVQNGKLTVTASGADLSDIVPLIDDDTKRRNRQFVDEQREVLESAVPDMFPESIAMLIASKIRIPIYQSISENHFSVIFSDKDSYEMWRKKQLDAIHDNIKILRRRCARELSDEMVTYLLSPDFESFLNRALDRMVGQFRASTLAAVSKKLYYYERLADGDRKKELIDRAEDYLRGLR